MMDMKSRNQYLKELRTEYLKTKSKKKRGELLDEAEKRTKLKRKYLMDKLKPKSNLDNLPSERKRREEYYDGYVRDALVQMWKIFDYPCGQRLEPILKTETDRMRKLEELICSNEVASKLKKIGIATIDRKLKHEREVERINRKYRRKIHPLLYQKIPVKVFDEQDRRTIGNIQNDLVEHCGQSASGEFVNTLSNTDISNGWWEGEAIMTRGQIPTQEGLERAEERFPFDWKEIHSDSGKEFINAHLFNYTQKKGLGFSRSRPYKKNDNCLVEQKNWTHVRKFIGYSRYDSLEELNILNDIYRNELRLFKNYFQPVIKLILKERVKGRIHRKYDKARTPYHRIMESKEVPEKKKQELKIIYESLNPAQLKRDFDRKLSLLAKAHQEKNKSLKVDINKKLSVRFSTFDQELVSVR
ncbi:hypothetical protein KJ671_03610 [Patescibacteria group bacterium]|nr:hypothetical protein [Patescibacteria group bacterium]